MHEPVRSQLEEILQGTLDAAQRLAVDAHLEACPDCRLDLQRMRLQSMSIREIRPLEAFDPQAGFYARVMQRIEQQGRPSFWTLLLEPMFGQRLMYATAAMFLLMGAFLLATTPDQPELAQSTVEVLATPVARPVPVTPASFGQDMQNDREQFLVTLAAYGK